uniref:Uncharacterized protein n=1 Tax=Arundo donax TaxID=35708 RepID=A0A0A9A4T4_ARUDO
MSIGEEPRQSSNVTAGDTTSSVANTVMPFGEIPKSFPPILGEYTNLLLGAHHEASTTTSTSRSLDFDQDPSTSII